jgi:hypothetical protein
MPIGLFFALGLREWARLLSALASWFSALQETLAESIIFSIFYLGFVALDLVCLYRFIVPYFAL